MKRLENIFTHPNLRHAVGQLVDAGRPPVRAPDEVDVFNLPNSSCRIMALGSTQPLRISSRNLPGGK
jgi:hypothetical protein